MGNFDYVLVTAARNEEKYIEQTIRSVVAQTVLPKRWIIVSDGSTDRTDDIVRDYAERHGWIELLRMPERRDRTFSAQATCFNAGYSRLEDTVYAVIGNIDADISFEHDPEYFEFLLGKFKEDPKLGVAGTPFVEGGKHYDYRYTNIEHVSGACQLFRRECIEKTGGYIPIKGGGYDWILVTTARMNGWTTRTFLEHYCVHNRRISSGSSGYLLSWFRQGQKDYYLGGGLLWQIFRAAFQTRSKPYLLGGGMLLAGYLWAMILRVERPVTRELMEFHRREQRARLRRIVGRWFGLRPASGGAG